MALNPNERGIPPGRGPGGLGGVGSVDVLGQSDAGTAVQGQSNSGTGVEGLSNSGNGVYGESQQNDALEGVAHADNKSGVFGYNKGNGTHGVGVTAWSDHGIGLHAGGSPAGQFEGDVTINGNVTVVKGDITLTNGDCAEEFDVAATEVIEPGTVMILDQHGSLRPSQQAYDKKVAGVISGAGDYKPGLILGKRESSKGRMLVALVGKVYCKVDAQYASIEVGDLLTTSPTLGHAMKADDPFKAFGAVIGKALNSLEVGQGLIPILVTLQ